LKDPYITRAEGHRHSADRSSAGFQSDYISAEAMGSDEVLMELGFASWLAIKIMGLSSR
jgi:hypothetical protein